MFLLFASGTIDIIYTHRESVCRSRQCIRETQGQWHCDQARDGSCDFTGEGTSVVNEERERTFTL